MSFVFTFKRVEKGYSRQVDHDRRLLQEEVEIDLIKNVLIVLTDFISAECPGHEAQNRKY